MGLFLSKIMQSLSSLGTTQARILMLGLDAAGKTTILYKFKLNETVQSYTDDWVQRGDSSAGEECVFYSHTSWDVGGQDKIRPLHDWRHYNTVTVRTVSSSSWTQLIRSDSSSSTEAKNDSFHSILEDAEMA